MSRPHHDTADPSPIDPTWGCDDCGLLFHSYKRGLDHCRDSAAHAAEISSARESGGAIQVKSAIAAMLTWYQRIPQASLKDVKATVSAALIISDARLSGNNNPELRRALRKAMEIPQKDAKTKPQRAVPEVAIVAKHAVVKPAIVKPAVEKKRRRRHSPTPPLRVRDSLTPPPTIIAIFRVKLQSLSQFTTAASPAHFPAAVLSHYFQFIMTDDAASTPVAMLTALRLQFQPSSLVVLDWWGMINYRWVLRATAIGEDIAELKIRSPDDFPAILPWVKKAHGEGWNWLMEIGLDGGFQVGLVK